MIHRDDYNTNTCPYTNYDTEGGRLVDSGNNGYRRRTSYRRGRVVEGKSKNGTNANSISDSDKIRGGLSRLAANSKVLESEKKKSTADENRIGKLLLG
jgi:hypothetical protein